MKFVVSRDELESELQFLQGIAEKKKTIPILSNILLCAQAGGLTLAATDLEVSLNTECGADVSEEGSISVSAKKLFEVVRAASSERVQMASSGGEWLEVQAGGAYFRLVTLPPSDFPEVPSQDFGDAVPVPLGVFREMIRRTLFAVTKEDVRYSLNGALLEIGEGTVRMVATDAHRLAVVEKDDADLGTATQVRAIIPKKALAEIRDLADIETMLFAQDAHHLYFKAGNKVLTARVIEGQFPAYEKVIPQDNPHRVEFEGADMAAAIRRVSLLASERSRAVKFTFAPGQATIASSNPELGEAHEQVEVQYEGPELVVSFNAQYVQDFLAVASCERVELHLKDDASQGMMVPADAAGDLQYRYVIMPMRL